MPDHALIGADGSPEQGQDPGGDFWSVLQAIRRDTPEY
jgi:hypothetical protein